MRIISGEMRGRRLIAPAGEETRPTSDKVREALFDIIRYDVADALVLDLFGGSGALALEAISRGAARATVCDRSSQAVAAIRKNIALAGCADRVRLVFGDWKKAVSQAEEPFSLVFLDPPYRMADVYGQALQALCEKGLVRHDALVVMEHAASIRPGGIPEMLEITDERRYRDTALTMLRPRPDKGGDGT